MITKIDSIPLCRICKRRIYYLGKDICGKRDCTPSFIKLDRIKVISPLKLGYHINNVKPFVTGKVLIIKPSLFREDNLSEINYKSSNDDHPNNKISEKIIDTFCYEQQFYFITKSKNIKYDRYIISEWDEILMDISAYIGDVYQVRNLYLKGIRLSNLILENALLNSNIDLVKWLYKKKYPFNKYFIFHNKNKLSNEIINFLKDIGLNFSADIQNKNLNNNIFNDTQPKFKNENGFINRYSLQLNDQLIQINKMNQEIAEYEIRKKFNYLYYQQNLHMINSNIFNQQIPNIFFPIVEQANTKNDVLIVPTYNFFY